MSTLKVKELAAPTGYDLKIASGETLDLKSQGTVTMPAGHIIQVVNVKYVSSGTHSNSTSTWADTGLTASITPTSSSNKILVNVIHTGCGKQSGNSRLMLNLLRGSTVISNFETMAAYDNASGDNQVGSCSCSYLDSPSTTSATTYKTQMKTYATGSVFVGWGGSDAFITLMEVAQ